MHKKQVRSEESIAPIGFPTVASGSAAGLFDTVFQEVDEAIVIVDIEVLAPTPIITDVNRTFEDWTGYSRDRITGFSLYSLLDISEAGTRSLIESAITGHNPAEADVHIVGQDGSVFPVHLTMRPVLMANSALRYTCVLRRAEALASQALEIANRQRDAALRAKEELLARVSHELRTPLNGILGLSEMLKGEMLGNIGQEQYKDYATDIHMAGTKLLWRIEELLQLKLVEDDDWTPDDRTFNAGNIARGALQLLEPLAQSEDIIISQDIALNLPKLTADQGGFRQVVHGLVGNAVMAADKGSVVYIDLDLSSVGELCLRTRHKGATIAAHDIAAIFDARRDESVYDGADRGDLMGLYLAQRITERHSGHFETSVDDRGHSVVMAIFPAHRVG